MQMCSCKVRLGGSLLMQVYKPRISVAEIAVLRHIHGSDSVTHVKPTRMVKESHAKVLEQMRLFYGPAVITALWPGLNPKLPVKLDDIGISSDGSSEDNGEVQINDVEDAGDRVSRELAEDAAATSTDKKKAA